jgi:hypothetical protein
MISILTKKKVIYIDQCFISNFSKSDKKQLKGFKRISELLHKAVSEEKVVCPGSWFHREESSLVDRKFEKDLKHQLGYLGQVDFGPESKVESRQFNLAAKVYCGMQADLITYRDVFDKNPDRHLERWGIDANLNLSFLNISQTRKTTKEDIDRIRREVEASGQSFKERLMLEQGAYKKYLTLNYPYVLSNIFQKDKDAYLKFLNSKEFYEIPKFNIYTKMWSSILTGSASRPTQEGDWIDVQAIATYLPYTHIFTADTFMKHHIQQNFLDKEYQTKIFSPSSKDVDIFCDEIEKIIEETSPANVPVLSVVLIPDSKMKEDYWSVCQKLNNSRHSYENRLDKGWVELINVDDGECPKYYHKGAKVEIDPPSFMGFDRQITSENTISKTKEKARLMAKGQKVLFYEFYRQPDEDFVQAIMKCIEKNDQKPLGYELVIKENLN